MKQKLLKAKEAIALLDSMFKSGEKPSAKSNQVVKEGLQAIEDILKELPE